MGGAASAGTAIPVMFSLEKERHDLPLQINGSHHTRKDSLVCERAGMCPVILTSGNFVLQGLLGDFISKARGANFSVPDYGG